MTVSLLAVATLCFAVVVDDRDQLLKAMSDQYEINREHFAYGTFNYRLAISQSKSIDEALGANTEDALVCSGTYLFNAEMSLHEKSISPDMESRNVLRSGSKQNTQQIQPYRAICDGKKTLIAYLFGASEGRKVPVHLLQLSTGSDKFYEDFFFPLRIGQRNSRSWSLSEDTRAALRDEGLHVEHVDENARLGDTPTILVVLASTRGRRSYWIDLKRGACPLQIIDEVAASGMRIVIRNDDIRLVGGGWLPFRETMYNSTGRTVQVVLTNVDVSRPPGKDLFAVRLEKPTSVWDLDREKYFAPRTVWRLDDMPKPGSKDYVSQIHARSPSFRTSGGVAPLMPEEEVAWPNWLRATLVVVAFGFIFFFVIIGWKIIQRRK